MDVVRDLALRAQRSRRSGYVLPVVASAEEAKALARVVADQIAGLQGLERLLALSELDDVQMVIQARLGRLQAEIAAGRERIIAANDGGEACRGYVATLSLTPRPPR